MVCRAVCIRLTSGQVDGKTDSGIASLAVGARAVVRTRRDNTGQAEAASASVATIAIGVRLASRERRLDAETARTDQRAVAIRAGGAGNNILGNTDAQSADLAASASRVARASWEHIGQADA